MPKLKEQDTCKVPPWPTLATLPKWKRTMYVMVVTCSQREDERTIVRWVRRPERTHKQYKLEDPGRGLANLDHTLGNALMAMMSAGGPAAAEPARTIEIFPGT